MAGNHQHTELLKDDDILLIEEDLVIEEDEEDLVIEDDEENVRRTDIWNPTQLVGDLVTSLAESFSNLSDDRS